MGGGVVMLVLLGNCRGNMAEVYAEEPECDSAFVSRSTQVYCLLPRVSKGTAILAIIETVFKLF